MMRTLTFIVILIVTASCGQTYSHEEKNKFDTKIEAFLNRKKINCDRSSSGLYYKIIAPGVGDIIQLKDEVTFKYKGSLLNGKVFDTVQEPVTFPVQSLIGAWKEVMLYLRPGGKAFLVSPPQLGYGQHDLDKIPPNSILVFEIEVVSVK